jgi:leucyl-tRNA synthetase
MWSLLGHNQSVVQETYPQWQNEFLIENTFSYPVSFNGKTRFKLDLPVEMDIKSVELAVLDSEECRKWTEGKVVRKVIVVPNRIINIVI